MMPSDMDQPLPYVDVVFALEGTVFVKDHAWLLWQVLAREFPWLTTDEKFGIHHVKLSHGSQQALLSQRSRLILRVDRSRAQQLLSMTSLAIKVGDCAVTLSNAHIRELTLHTTLYAPFVVNPFARDEVRLMTWVTNELAQKNIRVDAICGKHHQLRMNDSFLDVYSLMLHGLSTQDSARMLIDGMGEHRLLGCGLFVPHKSASAVFN